MQQDALKALVQGWDGIGILEMPCGIGKTAICGHYLREQYSSSSRCIVFVSPLRIHASAARDRLHEFLPSYTFELVDTDGSSAVNIKQPTSPTFFTTTLMSVKSMFHLDADFIFDEAHHVRGDMIEKIKCKGQVLLMTATPSVLLSCYKRIFKYTMREGIEDGLICDYKIILPVLQIGIPDELSSYLDCKSETHEILKVCLFLASGMLLTGSSKCIVYCFRIQECALFTTMFTKVCEEYHGMEPYTAVMTAKTPQNERKQIIRDFKSTNQHAIVCSVNILNEGVDIPECDSICMTRAAMNEITAVQRLCRANRKVSNRVSKVAHCFIYSFESDTCVTMLSLLARSDPQFYLQIKTMHSDYDSATSGTDASLQAQTEQQIETVLSKVRVQCKEMQMKENELNQQEALRVWDVSTEKERKHYGSKSGALQNAFNVWIEQQESCANAITQGLNEHQCCNAKMTLVEGHEGTCRECRGSTSFYQACTCSGSRPDTYVCDQCKRVVTPSYITKSTDTQNIVDFCSYPGSVEWYLHLLHAMTLNIVHVGKHKDTAFINLPANYFQKLMKEDKSGIRFVHDVILLNVFTR